MPSHTTDTLSRPLKDLRISVTDRCNFRCPYCMPADAIAHERFLPKDDILTFEEIVRTVRLFVELGVTKLRITGGEPLLRREIETLTERLSRIQGIKDRALTTNGLLLGEKAHALKAAGLNRITVSLDALDDPTFHKMTGRNYPVARVLDGIQKAEDAGLHPVKINTVVQRDVNEHAILDLARRFHGTGHIVRFIEYMDAGSRNRWQPHQVVPAEEILRSIHAEMPLQPTDPNYTGEVARRYSYCDGGGEIGIIASITHPFCGDCTRARLSTDGKIYTCLFSAHGADLKVPLRSGATDDDLRERIQAVWTRRSDRYSELRAQGAPQSMSAPRIEMYKIGG